MLKRNNQKYYSGFSLIEAILAGSIFSLLSLFLITAIISGQESTFHGSERNRAVFIAEEGLEAARSIRNENFNLLGTGIFGIDASSGKWALTTEPNITDIFERTLIITDINAHQKEIISQVTWISMNDNTSTISVTTRFTDWPTAPTANSSTMPSADVCLAP